MSSREKFEAWGMSDPDLSEMLKSEVYASIAWMAWQAASKASEQQLAAVVAENAGLKDSVEHAAGCIAAAEAEGLIGVLAETTDERLADLVHRRLCHAYLEVETPATDAYLDEVRAQGVELFVSHMDHPHSPYEFTHGYMDKHAIEFAAQLRQGAAL